jgi:hypothetical protein
LLRNKEYVPFSYQNVEWKTSPSFGVLHRACNLLEYDISILNSVTFSVSRVFFLSQWFNVTGQYHRRKKEMEH